MQLDALIWQEHVHLWLACFVFFCGYSPKAMESSSSLLLLLELFQERQYIPFLNCLATPPSDHNRFWATIGPVGAEVVGLQILPSALSIVWLVLVLPCTFSEPMGLELKADSGNIYLHAQVFTGLMYVAAAFCMWFLRAWKIRELELVEEREKNGVSTQGGVMQPDLSRLSRNESRVASVKSKVKTAKGLFIWKRV